MGIFDWLFGDTDDEDAYIENMIPMDIDDEDNEIRCELSENPMPRKANGGLLH